MFSKLIAGALILTALPASAGIGPGMGRTTSFASRIQGSATVCTNRDTGNLFLRTGPGQNYQQVREIPNGEEVSLMGGEYSTDGKWWWHISHKSKLGWAPASFLCGDV
ncbi:SH3 type 3 domain protein [Calothrix sp. NIES-4071]|nr:SH3 type 3 domain protein [Calothrix sp. NIES-4071]BAZ61691.1 SH3 type 3 domain protein [Calothrix sp. NIES-4105]